MERTQGKVTYQYLYMLKRFVISDENGEMILLGPSLDKGKRTGANIVHVARLLDASDGMTTEQAVKYIEHGKEMKQAIESMRNMMEEQINNKVRGGRVRYVHVFQTALDTFNNLLAKMEGK